MSDIPDILILYPKSKIEALERTARADASIAKQLSQSMSINARLQARIQELETALRTEPTAPLRCLRCGTVDAFGPVT
jgi:hypothetical protein